MQNTTPGQAALDAATDVVRNIIRVRRHESVVDAADIPRILSAYRSALLESLAEEIMYALDVRLRETVGDPQGWLSDAQDAVEIAGYAEYQDAVRFHGTGSIDTLQIGEYAANLIRGTK